MADHVLSPPLNSRAVPRPRQAHPVHRCGCEKRLAAARSAGDGERIRAARPGRRTQPKRL